MMRDEINQTLAYLTEKWFDGKVKEACRYSLLANGKRLRPMMMLVALQSYGIDYHPYLETACAIEMIHTYSLIHDDLPAMDDDDLRRGRLTCHKYFDEATAILAGDALLTEAFDVISRQTMIPAEKRVKLLAVLSRKSGVRGMIYGQQLDLYYEEHSADLADLEKTHCYKTGCLFEAPLMMAGIIADCKDVAQWEKLGQTLGLAFQVQDDILDVVGKEAQLGKKVGSDVQNHKSTYVTLLGLDEAKKQAELLYRETLALIYGLPINHGLLIALVEKMINRHG